MTGLIALVSDILAASIFKEKRQKLGSYRDLYHRARMCGQGSLVGSYEHANELLGPMQFVIVIFLVCKL
jgi:hypothetical protein